MMIAPKMTYIAKYKGREFIAPEDARQHAAWWVKVAMLVSSLQDIEVWARAGSGDPYRVLAPRTDVQGWMLSPLDHPVRLLTPDDGHPR